MTTTDRLPAPLGVHLTISLRPGADVDEFSGTVFTYPDRGPLSGFLLAGEHGAGVQLYLSTSCAASVETAEVEARAAERFARWASEHAAAARAHADRVALAELTEVGAR